MARPLYRQAEYWLSAHTLRQLPADHGREAAFAGRSNAGKSSAINVLTGQRNLARTSKTPGRTQQVIFFRLDEDRCLVDLPGYGYAKVPLAVKRQWHATLEGYLRQRRGLQCLVLVMDSRHPLKDYDEQLLEWCVAADMPAHVLLTKADKLSRNQAANTLREVTKALHARPGEFSVQLFSALKKQGVETLQQYLDRWLAVGDDLPPTA